jgi:hypothetical protein
MLVGDSAGIGGRSLAALVVRCFIEYATFVGLLTSLIGSFNLRLRR